MALIDISRTDKDVIILMDLLHSFMGKVQIYNDETREALKNELRFRALGGPGGCNEEHEKEFLKAAVMFINQQTIWDNE